jgi:hypothetical protein
MNILSLILSGITLVPGVIQSVESLFGAKSGDQKKQAALSAIGGAINLADAVAAKQVIDAEKFQGGLSKVIDGVVDCLNSSAWSKK